jgi:YebC/PmpR family DNA-binding regulatory protein
MSGHSKWATIKRKKGRLDAQRGRMFTKLIKEITVAARDGGGDPEANPRLRTAVATAKAANMPHDNIKRAIQKGTGELPGTHYEESYYEGYGPGGVAVLVLALTDNKNRTVAEIRHIFTRNAANLGEAGCVNWMFEKKGYITVDKENAGEEQLMEWAIDAGASDFASDSNVYEIYTEYADLEKVRSGLAEKGVTIATAEITQLPQSTVKLEGKNAEQMIRLMEALEEHEDVQKVYANFDIDEEILEELSACVANETKKNGA